MKYTPNQIADALLEGKQNNWEKFLVLLNRHIPLMDARPEDWIFVYKVDITHKRKLTVRVEVGAPYQWMHEKLWTVLMGIQVTVEKDNQIIDRMDLSFPFREDEDAEDALASLLQNLHDGLADVDDDPEHTGEYTVTEMLLEDHLDEAMSRRAFLRRLGLGAAGVAAAPALAGALSSGSAPAAATGSSFVRQILTPEEAVAVGDRLGYCLKHGHYLENYLNKGPLYHVTDKNGVESLAWLDNKTGKIGQHYAAHNYPPPSSHAQHVARFVGKPVESIYSNAELERLKKFDAKQPEFQERIQRQREYEKHEADYEKHEAEQRVKREQKRQREQERAQRQAKASKKHKAARRAKQGGWAFRAGRSPAPGPEAHEWAEDDEIAEALKRLPAPPKE